MGGTRIRARALARSLRALAHAPGFAATVVLILGVSIGMSAAMLTVFEGLLLRGLPIVDQERVVTLEGVGRGAAANEMPVSLEQYRRYRAQTAALTDVAGYAHWGTYGFAIRDGERPLALNQAAVTGSFFDVLGVRPVLGRLFGPDDERAWGPADASTGGFGIVLSHGAWRRVFGGDPTVIGRKLRMPTTGWDPVILGVAPPGLDFPRGVDYWIPAAYNSLNLIGRLRPGATLESARADYFNFIDSDPDYAPLGEHTLSARVEPIEEAVVGDVRPALLTLTAAVGVLLLLACVNVGNLLLVRASGRARELAIRRALGAGSLRIVGGVFAESALLAVASGLLGLGLARVFLEALLRLAPDVLPRADVIGQDGMALVVATAVTLLALLLFGLLPALGTLRFDLSSPLRADARAGTEGRGARRMRHVLVASQMALALIVLAGAGLLVRSFAHLAGMDPGFRTERLALILTAPPYERLVRECGGPVPASDAAATERLGACTLARMFALHTAAEARLAAVPSVEAASSVLVPPFLGPSVFMTKVAPFDGDATVDDDTPWFGFDAVGPDFFRTFGLPILRGRTFTAADHAGVAGVAIVSEGVARMLWPGEDALGKRFGARGSAPDSAVTVVGIVPDVHYREHRESTPTIYRPFAQAFAQGSFVVRTRTPLSGALSAIEAALLEVEPDLEVTSAQTMDELVAPQLAQPRLQAVLLTAFALAAVLIAAIGLYGIMAQSVALRRRELGVRLALGASPERLRRMVLRQAAWITGVGALAGLAVALAASRLVASLLFRVSPADPLTLGAVCAVLLTVALVAACVPAHRATRIDPAISLRTD